MAAVNPDIDLDVLRAVLANAENMVRYYGQNADKAALASQQNAVLIAAGLAPLKVEAPSNWDVRQLAEYRRYAEVLQAVIAHFEGESDEAEAA